MDIWEDWSPTRVRQKARRGPKTVSTAALWRRTEWLETRFEWRDSAVQFHIDEQWRVLDSPTLARTQRALQTLARRAKSDDLLRLARRDGQFELAQRLGGLNAPDLAALCSVSRRRNHSALERLSELLIVEALSTTPLEISPAKALQRAWPFSRDVLTRHLTDEKTPIESRALAAWCLGTHDRTDGDISNSNLRRVARLAQFHASFAELDAIVPTHAALRSESLFWRLVVCWQNQSLWKLTPEQWRSITVRHGVEKAVEVAEHLAESPDFWPELPVFETWLRPESIALWPGQWQMAGKKARTQLQPRLVALALKDSSALPFALQLMHEWTNHVSQLNARLTKKQWQQMKREENSAVSISLLLIGEMEGFPFKWLDKAISASDPKATLSLTVQALERVFAAIKGKSNISTPPTLASCREMVEECTNAVIRPLLDICGDGEVEIARRLLELEALGVVGNRRWPSNDWLKLALFLAEQGVRSRYLFTRLERRKSDLVSNGDDGANQALNLMKALFEATNKLEKAKALEVITTTFEELSRRRFGIRQMIPKMIEPLRLLSGFFVAQAPQAPFNHQITMTQMVCGLVKVATEEHLDTEAILKLCKILVETLFKTDKYEQLEDQLFIEQLALQNALSAIHAPFELDEELFRHLLQAAWLKVPFDWFDSDNAVKGARALRRISIDRSDIQCAVESLFKHGGKKAAKVLASFHSLAHSSDLNENFAWINDIPQEINWQDWQFVLEVAPDLKPEILKFVHWTSRAGLNNTLLKGISEAIEAPQKWALEVVFLEAKTELNEKLQSRLKNLRLRIEEEGTPAKQAQRLTQIREILAEGASRSANVAIQKAMAETARRRLHALCGTRATQIEIDADWLNAVLLACQIEDNRKWARELLKRRMSDETNWREELPNNARFLKQLGERSIQTAAFLGDFKLTEAGFEFWIERDPLGILQMGNRFNTCLSLGGCNEHSSIANAIDLNKIVVYARDAKGVIVGQQLWAVSEAFELVGFTIYSTARKEQRAQLETAFSRCAEAFAAQCGMKLADWGDVSKLVVPHWYDDGVMAWEKLEKTEKQTKSARPSKRRSG